MTVENEAVEEARRELFMEMAVFDGEVQAGLAAGANYRLDRYARSIRKETLAEVRVELVDYIKRNHKGAVTLDQIDAALAALESERAE